MKRLLLILAIATLPLAAQTNSAVWCDLQAPSLSQCFTLSAPATIASSFAATLPAANAAGALTNNGSGVLTWSTAGVTNGFVMTGETTVGPPSTTMGLQAYYDPTGHQAYMAVYNASGALAPLNLSVSQLAITSGSVAINAVSGYVQAQGFVSDVTGGSWQGFNSNTDGALLRGYGVAVTAGTQAGTASASGGTLTCVTNCPFPASPTLIGSMIWFDGQLYQVNSGGGTTLSVSPNPPGGTFAYIIEGTAGGYVDYAPVSYSPNSGQLCIDQFGNTAMQPVPLNGLSVFGMNDVIVWNSSSPLQGYHAPFTNNSLGNNVFTSGTPCAAPIPAPDGFPYGLNLNSYIFANGGFATSVQAFNAFEAFHGGGMTGQSFTASGVYPVGTQLSSGFAVNAYDHTTVLDSLGRVGNQYGSNLGGYLYSGFSDQNPGNTNTWNTPCTSIAVCDNPLIAGVTLAPGEISYNTTLNCEVVYSGTAWGCIGTAGPWTLSGSNLFPNLTTYNVALGETTNTSGAKLEVAGVISSGSATVDGEVQSYLFDTGWANVAFQTHAASTGGCGQLYCFQVDYYGDVSAGGSVNARGNTVLNLAPYRVNGTAVIDSSRDAFFTIVTATGPIIETGASQGTSSYNTAGSLAGMVLLDDSGTSAGAGGGMLFTAASQVWRFAAIRGFVTNGSGNSQGDITFLTRPAAGNGTLSEAMRLDSLGHLLIGTATDDGSGNVLQATSCSGCGGPWTLSGSNLFPTSTVYNVALGETTNTSGAKLEVAGVISSGSATVDGEVQSYIPSISWGNVAFQTHAASTGGCGNVYCFQVDFYGDVSAGGSINADGNAALGLAPYRVNGTTVIDSSRNATFNNLTIGAIAGSTQCLQVNSAGAVSGFGTGCGAAGGNWTLTSPSLYPASTAYNVLIGEAATTVSGSKLEVNGVTTFLGTAQAYNSSALGAIAFQTANSTTAGCFPSYNCFLVDFYGDVSSGGSINASGNAVLGLAPYRVNSTTVIDNGRNGYFNSEYLGGLTAGDGTASYLQQKVNSPGGGVFAGTVYSSYTTGHLANVGATYTGVLPAGLYQVSGYLSGSQTGPAVILYFGWTDDRGLTPSPQLIAFSDDNGSSIIVRLSGSVNPYFYTANANGTTPYNISVTLTKLM